MNKKFCERFKALRKENKLTQPQVAEAIGVSNGVISFWENGVNEPTLGYIVKICEIFEVSADYLLGLVDD